MRSGESSIEQRPDTRICVVQRISGGLKECECECQRKSAAVEKECRTSGGHRYDGPSLFTDLKARKKQFVFNSVFNRKPVKSVKDGRYVIKFRSSTDEPCIVALNIYKPIFLHN